MYSLPFQVMKKAHLHGLRRLHRRSCLATAYVIKEQILETIEVRHANERVYQTALEDWKTATSIPETHPAWSQFHANALQDTLRKANARRKKYSTT